MSVGGIRWKLLAALAMVMAAGHGWAGEGLSGEGGERVRGIVAAPARAQLSVETNARITKLPFREGQAFGKGDVLAAYDCRLPETALRAARAAWQAANLKARSKKRLVKFQAAGKLDARIAMAESAKALAEVEAAKIKVSRCKVLAPFSGRVVERHAEEHETPGVGKPLITIVSTGRLEVEMIAPSKWLAWIRKGDSFTFKVDETGAVLAGRIERIGAVVDAVSQTVRLHGVLEDPPPDVLPGMSGTAQFRTALAQEGGGS